jgi:pimeloyl-ACP methyl ester carboxylesterase
MMPIDFSYTYVSTTPTNAIVLLVPGFGLDKKVLDNAAYELKKAGSTKDIMTYQQATYLGDSKDPYQDKVDQVKQLLSDNKAKDITVVAHSQGAILISLAVLQLPTDSLPNKVIYYEPEFDQLSKKVTGEKIEGDTSQLGFLLSNLSSPYARHYVWSSIVYALTHPVVAIADVNQAEKVPADMVPKALEALKTDKIPTEFVSSKKETWYSEKKLADWSTNYGLGVMRTDYGAHDWVFARPDLSAPSLLELTN